MTMRAIFLACGVALSLSACAGAAGVFQTQLAPVRESNRQERPVPQATGQTPGFLYWDLRDVVVRKLHLSDDKEYGHRQFGVPYSLGLAIDKHGSLFESFFNPGVTGGVAILNKRLHTKRTINIADDEPIAVAVDASDRLYVLCYDVSTFPSSVQVFSPSASGNATPIRTIVGKRTGLGVPTSIAVDSGRYVYVANTPLSKEQVAGIEVFAPNANGNRKPVRVVAGDQTGLTDPVNIALGADGNIYVANQLSPSGGSYDVLVFPIDADGNTAPIRTLESGQYGYTIALGTDGEMYLGIEPFEGGGTSSIQQQLRAVCPGCIWQRSAHRLCWERSPRRV